MPKGFADKVQTDIKQLAATERWQLLKWLTTMVEADLTAQGAVSIENAAVGLDKSLPQEEASPLSRTRKGSALTPELDDLTYRINGCGLAVYRRLGSGLREDTYQRAMEAQFTIAGLAFVSQPVYEVYETPQGGKLLGYYIPDFTIEQRVIVDLKVANWFDMNHLHKMICYLAVTAFPVGLLHNFGAASFQCRRVLPPRDVAAQQINYRWLFVPDSLKGEPASESRDDNSG